eukprot:gene8602-6038_t
MWFEISIREKEEGNAPRHTIRSSQRRRLEILPRCLRRSIHAGFARMMSR